RHPGCLSDWGSDVCSSDLVQSSVSALNHAQAAVVGFAVSEAFEIIFDTLDSTRKVANLRANPRIALVIGGLDAGDERTVQYEGIDRKSTRLNSSHLGISYA